MQIFGKHGGLLNQALAEQNTFIALPFFAIPKQLAGNGGNASVDRVLHRLAVRIEVVRRVFRLHAQNVIETASDQQAGKRAQPPQTALSLVFVETGMTEARRRLPPDSRAPVFAIADVESAIGKHRES